MISPSTIKFLKDLKKNNNKPWFDANRERYDGARQDFERFVALVIREMGKFDPDIKELQTKDCIFRINRDIRFSKNKTPYKTNLSASLDRGGKKSIYAGYYFHLEPGKSFVAGGIWMPMAPELKKIRQEIDYCLPDLLHILNDKKFKAAFGGLETTAETSLTNVPRGYEKTNPAAPFLKLKSLLVSREVPDASLGKPSLLKETVAAFRSMHPLIAFINKALE